ncbi:hypothetical protein K420107F6_06720 [Lactonifactor longoviformis]
MDMGHSADHVTPRWGLVSRIIGLPGDKVEIRYGLVYINDADQPLDDSCCTEMPSGSYGPYEVPPTVCLSGFPYIDG